MAVKLPANKGSKNMSRNTPRLHVILDEAARKIIKVSPNEPEAWVGWALYLLESLEVRATEKRPGQTALTKREFDVLFLKKLREDIEHRLTNRHW